MLKKHLINKLLKAGVQREDRVSMKIILIADINQMPIPNWLQMMEEWNKVMYSPQLCLEFYVNDMIKQM